MGKVVRFTGSRLLGQELRRLRAGRSLKWAPAAIALFLCGAPRDGACEVRSSPAAGELRLEVRPGRMGPWSPKGVPDARVLNPSGDLSGDGWPASAAAGGDLLAAWSRPSLGVLATALTRRGEGWAEGVAVSLPASGGTPVVTPLDGGWLVAVPLLEPGRAPSLAVIGLDRSGQLASEPEILEGERLADSWVGLESAWLLVIGDGRQVTALRYSLSVLPGPAPIPIEWERLALAPEALLPGEGADAVMLPQVVDLGRGLRAVCWQEEPGSLSFVRLSEAGEPLLPSARLELPGTPASQTAVFERLARELSGQGGRGRSR